MTMDSRDKKEPQEISESLEKALHLMEQTGDESPEDIKRQMDDPETLEACKLLYKYKNAMGRRVAAKPDVGAEWERFEKRNRPRGGRPRRQFWLGSLAGAAAAAVLVVAGLWWAGYLDKPEAVMVYQSTDAPRDVILETGDGALALDVTDDKQLSALQGVASRRDTMTLAYAADNKTVPDELHTLSTPSGKDFKLILADGTVVWLNERSRLQYPARFGNGERKVSLRGEAYFQVSRKAGGIPFVVETDRMQVRVLGTEFNLSDHSGTRSHLTLVKGSVEVCGTGGGDYVRVKPGEDVSLNDDGSFDIHRVDTDIYVYWKEGYFFFDDTPLSEIMQQIGRWYNVDVVFDNPQAMLLRLHYFCKRSDGIESALNQLNLMQKVCARFENGVVHIE